MRAAAISVEPIRPAPASAQRRRAQQDVLVRTCEGLYRFILIRVGGDRHLADDLLQQTCEAAAASCGPPESDERYEAWLRGVARNLIRKHWRTTRSRRLTSLDDDSAGSALAEAMESGSLPLETLVEEETAERLLLAITDLSAEEQRTVLAFYFDGKPASRIAAETGTSVKSVESKLYRIRSRLRAVLRDQERIGER